MTSPYYPDDSARQVMSPSITLGGPEQNNMAAQVPNYGGVDAGGAGDPALEGGRGRNRTMAEGQSLLNGVIGSQNPIAPGSRVVTTGSEGFEQPRGSGLPRSATSSRPRVEFPDGSGAVNTGSSGDATTGSAQDGAAGSGINAGQRVDATTSPAQEVATGSGTATRLRVDATTGLAQDVTTGSGATETSRQLGVASGSSAGVFTGSDANVRRFQSETLGVRSRPAQHTPAAQPQQQHQPTAAAQPQQYNISTPPQQPAANPEAPAQILPEGANALVALHARASRFLRTEAMDGNNAAAVEMGEVADANGDQMVWFTRIRGMFQRGMELVRPLPSASPTSWYSQSRHGLWQPLRSMPRKLLDYLNNLPAQEQ